MREERARFIAGTPSQPSSARFIQVSVGIRRKNVIKCKGTSATSGSISRIERITTRIREDRDNENT